MMGSGRRSGRCWRLTGLRSWARLTTGSRRSPRSISFTQASRCSISSCSTSMGLRLLSGWPRRVTRPPWCSYRRGTFLLTGGGSPAVPCAGLSRRASCQGMHFPRSSREALTSSAGRLRMAAWLGGLVLGLSAEWLARSGGQGLFAAGADLAVGWTLIGCGLIDSSRRPGSRVGLLLTLTGFAWFLGTLADSRIEPVAALGTALLFLHRGPLCHAIVGYPAGRPAGRLDTFAVVVA